MNFIFFAGESPLHEEKKFKKKNVKSCFLCLAYPCQMHPAAWLLSAQGSSEQVNRVGTDGQELGPGRWTGLRGRSRPSEEQALGERERSRPPRG